MISAWPVIVFLTIWVLALQGQIRKMRRSSQLNASSSEPKALGEQSLNSRDEDLDAYIASRSESLQAHNLYRATATVNDLATTQLTAQLEKIK